MSLIERLMLRCGWVRRDRVLSVMRKMIDGTPLRTAIGLHIFGRRYHDFLRDEEITHGYQEIGIISMAYNGATKVATVDPAWTTAPDATSIAEKFGKADR